VRVGSQEGLCLPPPAAIEARVGWSSRGLVVLALVLVLALLTPYARRVFGVHAGGARGRWPYPKVAPEGGRVTAHDAARGQGGCAF